MKAISFNQDELFEEFGGFCILYESVNYRNVDDLIKEFKIFEEFDEKLLKIYIKQILEGLLPFLSRVINAKGYKFYGTFHLGATYNLKNFDNMIVGKK